MTNKIPWQKALRLGGFAIGGYVFFRFFAPVLLPFAIGLLPAAAARRGIDRLQTRMPRWAAAIVCISAVYILFFLLLFFLGSLLVRELERFFASLPQLAQALTDPLHRLEDGLLRLASRFPDGIGAALEQWTLDFFSSGAGVGEKLYDKVFSLASSILKRAPDIGLFLLTAILSGFMLAAELPRLRQWAARKLPQPWQESLRGFGEKLKGTVLCWLKAQGKLMGITFLVLTAGFLILQVEYAFLLSLLIALIDALPVLGSGLILIPWSLVQFLAGDTFLGVGLLCIYGAAALIRTAMEPRLLGRQMGLDPLLTLLAMYAGYRFFGIGGMILFPMGAMLAKQILN